MKRKNGITKNEKMRVCFIRLSKSVWQGHKDSNPGHVVLETTALPTELYPYKICISMDRPSSNPQVVDEAAKKEKMAEKMGFEPMHRIFPI